MLDSIKESFTESIQIQIAAAEALPDAITHAAQAMVATLLNGNKILCCGNGGSASNAQQFVSCLLNRFETERPSLPAMALMADNTTLTAVANDYHYEEIFSKQVRAFGQTGDILLAISTSGNSKNIIKAMEAAVTRDMTIIAFTGKDGETTTFTATAADTGADGIHQVLDELRLHLDAALDGAEI